MGRDEDSELGSELDQIGESEDEADEDSSRSQVEALYSVMYALGEKEGKVPDPAVLWHIYAIARIKGIHTLFDDRLVELATRSHEDACTTGSTTRTHTRRHYRPTPETHVRPPPGDASPRHMP